MKKVFDIFPPGKVPKRVGRRKAKRAFSQILSSFLKKLSFFIVFLLFLGGFAYYIFPLLGWQKVTVEIWPQTKILQFNQEISLKPNLGPDSKNWLMVKAIPKKQFEIIKSGGEQFLSSEVVLKKDKAHGTIRVYNNYSTSLQAIIARTEFRSKSGKSYQTPKKIIIPGKKMKNGKWIPGYVDATVIAAEGGKDYNIGPTTFTIPGLQKYGNDVYNSFWAESFSPMTGGTEQKVFQVTKEDISRAREALVKTLKQESKTELQQKAGDTFALLPDTLVQDVISTSCLAKPGAQVERFNFEAKVKSQILGFNKEDLREFGKQFIISRLQKDKRLQEGSLEVKYHEKQADLHSGLVIIDAEFLAEVYSYIDKSNIKTALKGRLLQEATQILENKPEVLKAKIQVFPFWVKEISDKPEQIKVLVSGL